MENEEEYGPLEFHKLVLAQADAALTKFKRLTKDDREAIEAGLKQFTHGLALLGSDDPELLRDAARRMMFGAYTIGSRANVSDSAIIFRNIDRHGPGGKKGARTRNNKADVWRGWVRQAITENDVLPTSDLAEKLRFDDTAPRNLPSYDRLVRFINEERKARKSGEKRKLLRLVRG